MGFASRSFRGGVVRRRGGTRCTALHFGADARSILGASARRAYSAAGLSGHAPRVEPHRAHSASTAPRQREAETNARVHPTAVVHDGTILESGAVVGPYCVVGPLARVGRNTVLHSHVVIDGRTHIGEDCELFPYSVIGCPPQDRKHRERETNARDRPTLILGARCVVREHATINGGSSGGGLLTSVGEGSLLLTGCHVGHDCIIGKNVVLSNLAQLAGHCQIGDGAILGGGVALRQFLNVGRLAMIGGASAVDRHVLPFTVVRGNRAKLSGVNVVGLRRRGVSLEILRQLQQAIRTLQYRQQDLKSAAIALRQETKHSALEQGGQVSSVASAEELISFVLAETGDPLNKADFRHLYAWGAQQKRLGIAL